MATRVWTRKLCLLGGVFALVAAACGDDDGDGASAATDGAAGAASAPAATAAGGEAGSTTPEGTASSPTGGSEPESGEAGGDDESCDGEVDASLDEAYGVNAGQMAEWLTCTTETPLAADDSLDPVVIGLINSQGDPSFSFPDITGAFEAAVEYINTELGGIGSDPSTGTPGRPVRLETCFVTLDPADSVACANEMAGKKPLIVLQGFTQHGEAAYPILEQAGAVNVSGIPVSLADYVTPGVYGMAPGGGCVGAHPALIEYAVNELGAKRIAVPWLDIPAGRVCYYDLEEKPLSILQGSFDGPDGVEGSAPDLEFTDVPIPFGAPDLSTQATQILDFDPDAILFSSTVGSCVSLVNALSGLGWTAEDVPAIFTGACFEQREIEELGASADGIIFVDAGDMTVPDAFPDGLYKRQAEKFATAMADYAPADTAVTGNGAVIFQELVTLWQLLTNATVDAGLDGLDRAVASEAIGSTVDHHMWGATPLSCGEPVEGYSAICNTLNTATQWDAEAKAKTTLLEDFDGSYIIAGTELAPEIAGG